MSLVERALDHVRSISPYQPGKPVSELAREMNLEEAGIVKLASNENPLGMSPLARAAATGALDDLARYPDGNGFALKAALAARYGVESGQIVLGNGSNDVLELIARVFLAPGRESIFSEHAFAVYPLATMAAGGRCVQVAAHHYGHDLAAMRAAVTPATRVIWIANPNNPTGTFLPFAEVKTFAASLPDEVVVVLDEAYNEYLAPADRAETTYWLAEHPNLVITRTFSKIYGLAGLRVGYALASIAVADLLNRIRQPFNVNSLALVAAEAALDDHAFVAESYRLNQLGMAQLVAGSKRLGLEHIPSHGNFVCIRVGDAAAVNQRLLRAGVIVRPIAAYGLGDFLRVSIGTESENARFLEALADAC